MQILTLENTYYSLNTLPDEVTDETRFGILDNSNPLDPDFYFVPLIFLESFNSPAVVLNIGNNQVTMPLDWSIAVGDGFSHTNIEILPLTSLNNRGFEALVYNPLSSYRLEFQHIEIINFYNDVKWYFPKMRSGQLLVTPLQKGSKPDCVYFTKDVPRQSEIIHLDKLL